MRNGPSRSCQRWSMTTMLPELRISGPWRKTEALSRESGSCDALKSLAGIRSYYLWNFFPHAIFDVVAIIFTSSSFDGWRKLIDCRKVMKGLSLTALLPGMESLQLRSVCVCTCTRIAWFGLSCILDAEKNIRSGISIILSYFMGLSWNGQELPMSDGSVNAGPTWLFASLLVLVVHLERSVVRVLLAFV